MITETYGLFIAKLGNDTFVSPSYDEAKQWLDTELRIEAFVMRLNEHSESALLNRRRILT